MLGLVLQVALCAAPSSAHDAAPPEPGLLAQATAPAPEGSPATEAVLEVQLAALNRRILAIDVHWPTGALIAAYTGGLVVYATLITTFAVLTRLSSPAPLAVLISLGVAGVGLLVGGLVAGANAAASAKADRDALILERDQLKRELDELRARPGLVEWLRSAPAPTLTLARF
ncbi:MAG: hypothetical protein JNJ54_32120 [Myxococcaceae bacterium]|nr:hypothetical protein [Myxococcaceae bacterium]